VVRPRLVVLLDVRDLVRVRENGIEHNEGRARALALGLEILDEPTHIYGNRRPANRVGGRPVKPRTTVAKQAAAKKLPRPSKGPESKGATAP
jgi:hypothetical protein